MFGSKLTKALTAALQDPTSAAEKIQSVSKEKVRTAGEAELVAQVLTLFPLPPGASAKRAVGVCLLHDVVAWFQGAEAEEAVAVFRQRGAAELLRIFDEAMARASVDWRTKDDLLFLLKIVCVYGAEGGLERLVSAVRSPLLARRPLVVGHLRHRRRGEASVAGRSR